MGETIGLISLKGGVGKTTLSAAIAANLANNHGKKVLLVDANYSAPNLGLHMDIISAKKTVHDVLNGHRASGAVHKRHGVDVIPGNFLHNRKINPMKLKDKLSYLKRKYDYVVLDSSPSLNEEVLSTMLASDKLFVVATADYPTLSCAMKAAKLAKQRGAPISGIIVNKSFSNLYDVSLEEIQESTGIPVVAKIKEDKSVRKALFMRQPANLYSKRSGFSKEVDRLCHALVGKDEKTALHHKVFGSFKKEKVNREILKEEFYTSVFK